MALSLILLPIFAALLAYFVPSDKFRKRILPTTALFHLAGVCAVLAYGSPTSHWLSLDALGGWVLLVISTLFAICAFYAPAYLALRPDRNHRIFIACFLGFLGLASLVAQARHPGLVWVAMESMTLTTARLIYFNHNQRSLEATWKYLMIGSVGIALALLGTLFLAYSAHLGGLGEPLHFLKLMDAADQLSKPWLKAGFVLCLIGYGTKMGIAPLHTWKPDAYGESPGILGALLAGGVTSCAFLALMRMYAITTRAGEGAFAKELMIFFGLLSMIWAFVFLVRQTDLKRMLAYSSVEHMGILLLGIGLGGQATRFALYHMAANALTKSVLFLSAGNIHRSFNSKQLPDVTGAIHRTPISAWLLLISFLAITGLPPFAPFFSEFNIARAALLHRPWMGLLFMGLLAGIFIAMSHTLTSMIYGQAPKTIHPNTYHDCPSTTFPLVMALLLALGLGLHMPPGLSDLLTRSTLWIEGQP